MKELDYTFSKSKVDCYKLRDKTSGMYWADITVDAHENTGRIQIASDFGDYQYYWGSCGRPFKEFLTRLNIVYASSKFGADKWFDLDATILDYKKSLLQYRRDGGDPATCRVIFNQILELVDTGSENEFRCELWNRHELTSLFNHCPEIKTDVSPQFKKFWNTAWQAFITELKKEVEEEKLNTSENIFV